MSFAPLACVKEKSACGVVYEGSIKVFSRISRPQCGLSFAIIHHAQIAAITHQSRVHIC
jgi:hypothetical protein